MTVPATLDSRTAGPACPVAGSILTIVVPDPSADNANSLRSPATRLQARPGTLIRRRTVNGALAGSPAGRVGRADGEPPVPFGVPLEPGPPFAATPHAVVSPAAIRSAANRPRIASGRCQP